MAGKIEKIAPKFIVNFGKSVTYSMNDALQTKIMPNTVNLVQRNSDGIRSATDAIKNYKTLGRKIKTFYNDDKTIKDIKEISKNAASDLVSGKWYNKERITANSDKISGFNNDWSVNFSEATVAVGKSTIAATNANTKAVISSSKNVSNTISATSKISNDIAIGTHKATMGALDVMNSNIGLVSTFNNDVMKPFIDNANKYFTDSFKVQNEIKDILFKGFEIQSKYYSNRMNMEEQKAPKDDDIENVLQGGFSFEEYKKVIKKNVKGQLDNAGIGMLQGSGIDLMENLKANPIGTIMESFVNTAMIPKGIQDSLKNFDDTIKGFLSSGILKINDIAKNGYEFKKKNPVTDFLSGVSSQIASLFKVDIKAKNNVSLKEYEKGAIAFDGVTKKAIVDVIPLYLRKILSALTGDKEVVFNYEEGRAEYKEDVIKRFSNAKKQTGFEYGEFENKMYNNIRNSNKGLSDKQKQDMQQDLKSFLVATEAKLLPLQNKTLEGFQNAINSMNLTFNNEDSVKNIFSALKNMPEKDILNFASDSIDARQKRNKTMKNMEQEQQITGLAQSLSDYGLQSNNINSKSLQAESNSRMKILKDMYSLMSEKGVLVIMKGKQEPEVSPDNKSKIWLPESAKRETKTNSSDDEVPPSKDNKSTTDNAVEELLGKRDEVKVSTVKNNNKDNSILNTINEAVSSFFKRPTEWFKNTIDTATHKMYTIIFGEDEETVTKNGDSFFGKLKFSIGGFFDKLTTKLFGEKDDDGNIIKQGLINQAKIKLLGEKDENGNVIQTGMLTGVSNVATDSAKSVRRAFTGKGYTDSQGVEFLDDDNAVFKIAKSQITSVTSKVSDMLFGTKDADGNRRMDEGFINSMYKAVVLPFKTFKEEFFGNSNGDINSESPMSSKLWAELKEASPELGKGAMIGGVAGLLLPGGPVLGSLVGTGIQMIRHTKTFNEMMFGETDEEGNRKDGTGIIPQKWQSWFKDNGLKIKKGAIAGGMMGLFLPGGPIVGSLIGSAITASGVTDKLKTALMGEKDDKTGEFNGGLWGKLTPEQQQTAKKLSSSVAAGGLIGMFTPGGPLVGALALSGANMLITSEKFKNILFGDEDENGKRDGGVVGSIKTFFNVSMATPMKLFFQETTTTVGYWMNKTILNPVKDALAPFKKEAQLMFQGFKDMGKNFLTTIDNSFSKYIGTPLTEAIQTKLIDPITKGFKSFFGGIGKVIMGVVGVPFKALQVTSDNLMKKHIKLGEADYLEERLVNRRERNAKQDSNYQAKMEEIKNKKSENDGKRSDFFKSERDKKEKKRLEAQERVKVNKVGFLDRVKNKFTNFKNESVTGVRTKGAYLFNGLESDADIERLKNANDKNAKTRGKTIVDQTIKSTTSKTTDSVKGNNKVEETSKVPTKSVINNVADSVKGNKQVINIKKPTKIKQQPYHLVKNEVSPDNNSATDNMTNTINTIKNNSEKASNNVKPSLRPVRQTQIDLGGTIKDIAKYTGKIWDEIKGQFNGVGDNLDKILNVLERKFDMKGEGYGDQQERRANKKRKSLLGKVQDFITKPFRYIADFAVNLKDNLIDTLVTKPANAIKGLFVNIKVGFGKVIGGIGTAISSTFEFGLGLIKGAANIALKGLEGLGEVALGVGSALGSVISGVGKVIGSVASGVAKGLQPLVTGFGKALGGVASAFGDIISGVGKGLGNLAKNVIPALGSAIGSVTGAIFSTISGLAKLGMGALKGVGNLAKNAFPGATNLGVSANVNAYITGGVLDNIKDLNNGGVEKRLDSIINIISGDFKVTKAMSNGSTEAQIAEARAKAEAAEAETSKSYLKKIADSTSGLFTGLFSKKKGLWGIVATVGAWILNKWKKIKTWLQPALDVISILGRKLGNLGFGGGDGNSEKSNSSSKTEGSGSASKKAENGVDNKKSFKEKLQERRSEKKAVKEASSNITNRKERREFKKSAKADLKARRVQEKRTATEKYIADVRSTAPSKTSVIKGATGLAGATMTGFVGDSIGRNVGQAINDSLNINQNGLVGSTITNITGAAGQLVGIKQGSKLINKALGTDLGKQFTELLTKVFTNKKTQKLIGVEASQTICKKVLPDIAQRVAAKAAVKVSAWIASGSALLVAQVCADIVLGMGRTRKYFKVPKGQSTTLTMNISAGIAEALNGVTFGVVSPYWLAKIIYESIGGQDAKDKLVSYEQQITAQAEKKGKNVDDYNNEINESWSEKAWKGTKNTASNIWSGTKKVGSSVVSGTKKAISSTVDFVSDLSSAIGKSITSGSEWLGKKLDSLWESASVWFSNKYDYITKTIPNSITEWGSNKIEWLTQTLPSKIGTWFSSKFSGVIKFFDNTTEFFKSVSASISNAFSNWWKDSSAKKVMDWFGDIASGIGNTGKSAIGRITEFGKSLFGIGKSGSGERKGKRYISSGRGTANGMTYYSQKDPKWADKSFKANNDSLNDTIGSAGCGPTAVSMALSKYGVNMTPAQTAQIAQQGGYKVSGEGTSTSFITDMLNSSGVSTIPRMVDQQSMSDIDAQLATGNPVITLGTDNGGSTPYTNAGHYLVIGGKDKNGNYKVNDPLNPDNNSKSFKPDELLSKTNAYWSDSEGNVEVSSMTGGAADNVAISAINAAKSYLGSPYVWGGTGSPLTEGIVNSYRGSDHDISKASDWRKWLDKPGFDCSGLMQKAYADAGIKIGRSTYDQVKEGSSVSKGSEKPSDLVMFGSASAPHHVGMYLGNGKFIHAPKSGDEVKISELTSRKDYSTARRIIGNAPEGDYSDGSANSVASTGSVIGNSNSSPLDVFSEMSSIFGKAISAVAFNDTSYLKDEESSINSSSSSSSDGDVSVTGNNNVEKVWNFFNKTKGFTKQATAGILGNMQQESGVDPTKKQYGGGPGRGLIQWEEGGRWDQLRNWATSSGKDPWAIETQLQYLWKELSGDAEDKYNAYLLKKKVGGLDQFGQLTDYKKAVQVFEESVERAGIPMYAKRYKYAEQFLNEYGNGSGRGLLARVPKLSGRGLTAKTNKIVDTMKKFTGRGTTEVKNVNTKTNIKSSNNNYKLPKNVTKQSGSGSDENGATNQLLSAILNVLNLISGNTSAIALDTSIIKEKETKVTVQPQSSSGRGESTETEKTAETPNIFLGGNNNQSAKPSKLDNKVMKLALGDLT